MANRETGDDKSSYKVLVIGDYAVGKTSIIKRYTEGVFTPNYKLTIGVDFGVKTVERNGEDVRIQLWDIAGHERFGSMTRVYYRFAVAAVIVYDVTRAATREAVLKWKEDVDAKVTLPDGSRIPCLLLANKADATDEATINRAFVDNFAQENGFFAWYPTSALSNLNIGLLKYNSVLLLIIFFVFCT